MLSQLKSIILFSIIALATFSCKNTPEEIVLDDLSQEAKQLVVVGFISPQDSILAVKVSSSAPIGSSFEGSILTNATVTLSTGSSSVRLTYNASGMVYQALAKKFPIQPGNTYTLTVTTSTGQRAESTCTIPAPIQLQHITLDSTAGLGAQKQYVVRYQWQDPANQRNFYQVAGAFQYTKTATQQTNNSSIVFGTPSQPADLQSDEAAQGTIESLPGIIATANEGSSTFLSQYRQATVLATLLHVEESYYRYHKAVELANATNGNPFAEPVSVPSNIKGGLGCFAGYNQAVVKVKLK